ncbi:hypothetical protein JK386_01545 [Nocardioides sp. zg-536]|uniref:DUF5652 domain-containing protein n=1 Tax=Nocardioides faecalis TaxID=2803858 RepID=A0A938Y3G7_9ACTN|nr:hypothetical protein [Nocardioides faecalis]MBM9458579.1 hypothetical protein [Nocardioides faecalis]MBS4752910.1 hypothetical protein [Nocardioides faecalis]QVI58581.1 hypothetical protein KG111_16635 [Nocardioides faecalis]
MAKRWSDLSPRARKAIVVVAGVDGALRTAALVDLRRRDAREVNGSRRLWTAALATVSSAGVVPVVYFLRGRRR